MMLILGVCYLESASILRDDEAFIDKWTSEKSALLRLRPLLRISPAPGDWDLRRLLYANFLHGSAPHLAFNLIGAFAGARICSTFIPFLCIFSVFILGGSIGLLLSILLSPHSSLYIPHIGSSAGIFALMGTYYVYNFSFRTRYFFWYPGRHGRVALRTSWFFFVDAILLEMLMSAVQLLPSRTDLVDHLAHVVGFFSGVGLALLLRAAQRWPPFLQTRIEFMYWIRQKPPQIFDRIQNSFRLWSDILDFNRYNDRIKVKFLSLIKTHHSQLSETQLEAGLTYISPTFIRLHTVEVASCLLNLLQNQRKIPKKWLMSVPYDSLIRVAKHLATSAENQIHIFDLFIQYQSVHSNNEATVRKLTLLLKRLEGIATAQEAVNDKRPMG